MKGTSNGTPASALAGLEICLETPFGLARTGTTLLRTANKLRVRLLPHSQTHLSGQIAALSLLPNGSRTLPQLLSAPLVMEKQYILEAEFDYLPRSGPYAALRPTLVIARLSSGLQRPNNINIDVTSRMAQVAHIYRNSANLPAALASLVAKHRQSIVDATQSGANAGTGLRGAATIVSAIMVELGNWDDVYFPGTDPVPALYRLADPNALVGPRRPPVPNPTQIPYAGVDVRRRSEHILRLTKMRGTSAAKFRLDVQRAYNHTCAFCGFRAPGSPGLSMAGVDAAHILPWGSFNLDVPQNGIILCKQHHWAFDNHILILRYTAGAYFVDVAPDALHLIGGDSEALNKLAGCSGQIDFNRLPASNLRPDPRYIQILYASTS